MARYIDADKILEEKVEKIEWWNESTGFYDTISIVHAYDIKYAPTADVVPKSEGGAECPTCYGTGRIGTTNWLTKNMTKKQIAEEKAQAIAEHEQYIKTEYAREIFEEIDTTIIAEIDLCNAVLVELECAEELYNRTKGEVLALCKIQDFIAELKKKYTEEKE